MSIWVSTAFVSFVSANDGLVRLTLEFSGPAGREADDRVRCNDFLGGLTLNDRPLSIPFVPLLAILIVRFHRAKWSSQRQLSE